MRDINMKGWHVQNIIDRQRAIELARVRLELRAKLETALLIAKLRRMSQA